MMDLPGPAQDGNSGSQRVKVVHKKYSLEICFKYQR